MNKSKGFTLIELMIVIAIIGILAAVAVPNFLNARAKARAMQQGHATQDTAVYGDVTVTDYKNGVYYFDVYDGESISRFGSALSDFKEKHPSARITYAPYLSGDYTKGYFVNCEEPR